MSSATAAQVGPSRAMAGQRTAASLSRCVFFAIPTLIMVLASFRTPGEFGGLAPLVEDGKLDLNLESYARFFSEAIYAEIFLKSVWYALAHDVLLSRCSRIRWRRSSREAPSAIATCCCCSSSCPSGAIF